MKRLSLVGILCSILALMRLASCNDSSLPQDILGEWVADPKILKNLEWMGGEQTTVYALDWTFGSGNRGWIKAGKTLTLREEGNEAYLNVSIVTPIIYNVHDGGLSFRLDKDSIQVEILECLINGENYKDVVAQSVKGEGSPLPSSARSPRGLQHPRGTYRRGGAPASPSPCGKHSAPLAPLRGGNTTSSPENNYTLYEQ